MNEIVRAKGRTYQNAAMSVPLRNDEARLTDIETVSDMQLCRSV
jgi:hypothetical protein